MRWLSFGNHRQLRMLGGTGYASPRNSRRCNWAQERLVDSCQECSTVAENALPLARRIRSAAGVESARSWIGTRNADRLFNIFRVLIYNIRIVILARIVLESLDNLLMNNTNGRNIASAVIDRFRQPRRNCCQAWFTQGVIYTDLSLVSCCSSRANF